MSPGILLLSPELHLRIIDFVLQAPNEDEETKDEEKEDEQMDSTEHIVPANLKTLIKLSQTCSTFQRLLAPSIYAKLYLTNTETSAASVKAVAKGPFRDLVTELLFVGRAPGEEEEGFHDIEAVFPEEVKNVLTDLCELFPNLASLNVGFAYELNDYDKWDAWVYESLLTDVETDKQVLDAEAMYGCRALIAKVWTATSSNTGIKNLKMRHFIPKMSSTYSSASFLHFLGGVRKFEMSVWGCDNGAGWASSIGDGYREGLTKLDRIFTALISCTDFVLEASQYGWYGLEGVHHAPHAFRPGQMPLLRQFTLRHCFISPELKAFLEDHKDTLEEIVLQDCSASTNTVQGLAENGISWRELFDAMLCMKTLKRFEILPILWPESSDQDTSLNKDEDEDKEETKNRDEPARSDGVWRLFSYGCLDDKYADWWNDDRTQKERHMDGNDQNSWATLLAMIDNQKNS